MEETDSMVILKDSPNPETFLASTLDGNLHAYKGVVFLKELVGA